jgi:hypothetical protein
MMTTYFNVQGAASKYCLENQLEHSGMLADTVKRRDYFHQELPFYSYRYFLHIFLPDGSIEINLGALSPEN